MRALLLVALLCVLAACGGSRPARSTIARDGNVEVGEVKPLSSFALARVWGYTGMISPALPTGHRSRAWVNYRSGDRIGESASELWRALSLARRHYQPPQR